VNAYVSRSLTVGLASIRSAGSTQHVHATAAGNNSPHLPTGPALQSRSQLTKWFGAGRSHARPRHLPADRTWACDVTPLQGYGSRQQPGLQGPASGGGQLPPAFVMGPTLTRPELTLISLLTFFDSHSGQAVASLREVSSSNAWSHSSQRNSNSGMKSFSDQDPGWSTARPGCVTKAASV
jgi:hypothetical protein